jgi:biotin carboxylase
MTLLCLASYDKGYDFLREAKRQGATVVLLTSQSLQHNVPWPVESIDEIYYMPDKDHAWDRRQTLDAVSYLARTRVFDRIVPLDDFDVEVAAMLREHLRIPGMGETTARYFRDKLAMRMKAAEAAIVVPQFIHMLNYALVSAFMDRVPGPWLLKPRSMAGAIGIKKVHSPEELWPIVAALGDQQSHYVLERFVAGDIFHVDSILYEREVRFAIASGYGRPPLEVSHGGGIFTTRILERECETAQRLLEVNARVLAALGLVRGVSHSEYIIGRDDGRIYFLETSARVGGAHIADLVESATGLNLWAEWANVEVAGGKTPYQPPAPRNDYAGLLVSLARQEHPDTSQFNDSEIVWRMDKPNHIGLIVQSPEAVRVQALLADYTERVARDYHAAAPPRDTPSH